ncbi:MAG: DEAD/DEAH box helicase family protein [Acidobacteriota bacterium]|nr:DEAD/DEAH box helicase family protein [Acidobacteriota bacterium]
MNPKFFEQPILNSPYEAPSRHWELDENGQPTHRIVEARRQVRFMSPIPVAKKQRGVDQLELATSLDAGDQAMIDLARVIQELRGEVTRWRQLANPSQWQVTPETARLLEHWRRSDLPGIRPFFCQVEAAEAAIWLTEVAPKRRDRGGRRFLRRLEEVNAAHGGLPRLALKLATGAGKTMVMAMLIAWQTVNAVRRPNSPYFTRGFLVITPGITIRDRLRVLQPNDPDNYYGQRGLVPSDMVRDVGRARIVITNFHAFQRRERMALSKGARSLLQGRGGEDIETLETEGQMLQRVLPDLMGMKNILVFNDEAHHCYREKPGDPDEAKPKGDDLQEAKSNQEAARVWISGLESVNRRLGLNRVFDLSATPFFLRGSGYAEGKLFPWTMSDFSLMDAIESGIVKLPRVPVSDDLPSADVPMYRELWKHIGKKMPKGRRTARAAGLDPQNLPLPLQNALDALYGHYETVFEAWGEAGIVSPPCFIVVCNNTATSKLLFDYISGYQRQHEDGSSDVVPGRLELFSNFDDYGNPRPRPRTLLIDSAQLESGEGLDKGFRTAAADEIERFRREEMDRTGDRVRADSLSDEDLLREVMNTVGKEDRLGGSIRCVVSVSMLTEGWDANTVTHILGVRAFGTQLLCEQVIGRALRRQSYELNDGGLFDVEYADVFGVPFDFTAEPVPAPRPVVKPTIAVRAISPDRDHAEIRFPRVQGYRVELPEDRIEAQFTDDSRLTLTPELVGPTDTRNEPIIGEGADIDLEHLEDYRRSSLIFNLTVRLLETKYREADGEFNYGLFGKLKGVTRRWLDLHLECKGGTVPAQLMYRQLADMACEKIHAAIVRSQKEERPVLAVLDPFQPSGSTADVHFLTSKQCYRTDPRHCHVDRAVLDSGWEGEFCRVAEAHDQVVAYVKNDRLGLEIPYLYGSTSRRYLPDFVVVLDDGHGPDDRLYVLVEIKGLRGEDAKAKKEAAKTYWVEGVNNLGSHGRWAFAEFTNPFDIAGEFEELVRRLVGVEPAA